MLADLRYGTIGVNAWSGVGFMLQGASLGAYPGNLLSAVGSGRGVVHNARLIQDAERL
jgi:aldehyde dehydrogenase (NAD(P)+)